MKSRYLKKILGKRKIRLLMEGKGLDAQGREVPQEPALLTPEMWVELRSVWDKVAQDMLARDGTDPNPLHRQRIAGNEQLQGAIAKVFKGYMRGLAYLYSAEQESGSRASTSEAGMKQRRLEGQKSISDASTSEAGIEQQRLAGQRENADYDLQLYTQYATEYLHTKGGASEKDASRIIGSIIYRAIRAFCTVFPEFRPEFPKEMPEIIDRLSHAIPELRYPARPGECAKEPRSLRALRKSGTFNSPPWCLPEGEEENFPGRQPIPPR